MSKAEDRALEAYPPKMRYVGIDSVKYDRKIDVNKPMRDRYVKAYHQAEKDLEIAREEVINDIKERVTIFLEGAHEYTDNKKLQMQYDNEGLIRDFRAFIENLKQAMKHETQKPCRAD